MKKFLLSLLLLLALAALAVYAGGGWLVDRATRRALAMLPAGEIGGARVKRLDFRGAAVEPLAAVVWEGWDLEVELPPRRAGNAPAPVRAHAALARVVLDTVSPATARLQVAGFSSDGEIAPILPDELPFADEFAVPVERIDACSLDWPGLPVTRDWRAVARLVGYEIRQLYREGGIERDFRFSARLYFRLRNERLAARLETERVGGRTWLRLNRADVEEISRRYERPLTEGEKQVVHEWPLRAPTLLHLKGYAERVAKRLAAADRAYGEDFTRHVLWSYWLTRTFGPEFARRVTDAHEAGATGNTEADHRQDFANNEVGRGYALAKKSEGQVLRLIKTDPAIVRVAR